MNGWIFQGNPEKFKINNYLARQQEILWLVRPDSLASKIAVGDAVFMWRSDGRQKGSGGIIALGQIMDQPKLQLDDAPDLWIETITGAEAIRVRIGIKERRLTPKDGMLLRTDLKERPETQDLWILKRPSQTTFPLKIEHLHILLDLWKEQARIASQGGVVPSQG